MVGRNRIDRFVAGLKAAGADVALLSHPVDVYYLAGTAQPATMVVPVDGEPELLVNRNIETARRESWVETIRESFSFKDICGALTKNNHRVVGLSGDVLPANTYMRLQEAFPRARFLDVSMVLRRTRMIKDEDEILRIREAARIADAGHQAARRLLRPGVTELQMSLEIEQAMVDAGCDGFVLPRNMCLASRLVGVVSAAATYPPGGLAVAVSGAGSTPALPFGPSKRVLREGDVVVVDLCGAFDGYVADQSRTYVLGKASDEQSRAAKALKEVVERGLQLLKPGVKGRDIYETAARDVAEAGFGDYFMGPRDRNIRFCGHGVGLELDELPVLFPGEDTPLAEGMVIAFEPILLIPEVAVAVMENTVLVTSAKHERLTRTPLEMFELG